MIVLPPDPANTLTMHITLKVTDRQYHCLKKLAENDFRTIQDLLRIYIYIYKGFEFDQFDRELCVEKMQQDRTSNNPETHEYYKDEELVEFFKPVVTSTLEPNE